MPKILPLQPHLPNHTAMSDQELALAATSGDPEAFAAFFDRFHTLVTRYATRVCGSDDVEDLVQVTFLQIAEGKAHFEGRSKASTWLLGIATNVIRHHHRSKTRKRSFKESYRQAHGTAVDHKSPERDAQARHALQRIAHALAEQPSGHRIAFILCEVEGLSAREVGDILSIAETAVWKRVSDTRKKLKRALEKAT